MEKSRPIIFYSNNKQTISLIVFILVFTALSTWLTFFLKPHNHIAEYCFFGVGIFCFLITAFCAKSLFERMNGPKEILIISNEGITDRTTFSGIEVIKWKDIKGIREEFVSVNKFVRIDVYNPEDYIPQGKDAFKRRMLKNNMRYYGSPFVISARAIGMKHIELFELMRQEHLLEKEKNKPAEESVTHTSEFANSPTDQL